MLSEGKGGPKDLLDELTRLSDCLYLSNLHQPAWAPNILNALQYLAASQFSADEWQKALNYITGTPTAASSAEAARQQLLDHLKRSAAKTK